MTDDEMIANLAALKALQHRTNEGIHELLNIVAVLKGEVDLAVERARHAVDEFYRRHPEFLDNPS